MIYLKTHQILRRSAARLMNAHRTHAAFRKKPRLAAYVQSLGYLCTFLFDDATSGEEGLTTKFGSFKTGASPSLNFVHHFHHLVQRQQQSRALTSKIASKPEDLIRATSTPVNILYQNPPSFLVGQLTFVKSYRSYGNAPGWNRQVVQR